MAAEPRSVPGPEEAPALLRSMPRRPWLTARRTEQGAITFREAELPAASTARVAIRVAAWGWASARLGAHLFADRLAGRRDVRQKGARLRQALEQMGGTGIKLGQQLSSRVDLFPFEVCDELGKLLDRVPPFPVQEAVATIERASGRALGETFAVFDPVPIGSASIACVWQAVLRTGEKVAVKVRRPGVEQQFAADIRAVQLLTKALEVLTIVRPGLFRNFRKEVHAVFKQELDFAREARYQTLFRRLAKLDRLRWLGAPRVHHELSGLDVLVSEFVDGVLCSEIAAATDTGNPEALAKLREMGIDTKVVAWRVLEVGWWGRYECPFFHADPHPGNVVVRPGNEIVMLDFGACGVTSRKQAREDHQNFRSVIKDDISAVTEVALKAAMPLPRIDVDQLRQRLERHLWRQRFANISKGVEWWERSTAGLWIAVAAATRDLGLPLAPRFLELLRATLLYDTLALRLDHDLKIQKEFGRYERRGMRRRARRFGQQARRALSRRPGVSAQAERLRTAEALEWGTFWVESLTDSLPVGFQSLSKKSSYFFTVLIRFLLGMGALTVAGGGALWISGLLGGPARGLPESVRTAIRHPAYFAVALLLLVQAFRRIYLRLLDKDPAT